jgi:hypothetical protein
MRLVQGHDRTPEWDAPWATLAAGRRARTVSRGLNIALIIGLSALLWELLFTAVRWLTRL